MDLVFGKYGPFCRTEPNYQTIKKVLGWLESPPYERIIMVDSSGEIEEVTISPSKADFSGFKTRQGYVDPAFLGDDYRERTVDFLRGLPEKSLIIVKMSSGKIDQTPNLEKLLVAAGRTVTTLTPQQLNIF